MSMPDKTPLISILKDLREYISNEYNLNVEPRSYKGENAVDSSLPADWQAKLEPISGGQGGEKEGDKGAEKKATKAGSQGKDAYLHKDEGNEMYEESGKSPRMDVPQEGQEVDKMSHMKGAYMADNNDDGEMMDEGADEDMENGEDGEDGEGMEEDNYEEKMGDHDEVVNLLREIKGVLEHASMAKQSLSEIRDVRTELSGLAKSLPEIVDGRVADGIKNGLKQFGYNASGAVGDIPRRKLPPKNNGSSVKLKSEDVVPQQAVRQPQVDPARAIGVEGESLMKAADRVNDHDAFVDGVEQLAKMTQVDDLRGAFRLINNMREQSGESLTQNLYYYKR